MKIQVSLFALLITLGSMVACAQNDKAAEVPLATEPQAGIAVTVHAEEFAKLMADKKDAVILDVRTDAEIAEGCISGQTSMDFYEASFQEKLSRLDKNTAVLVYCRSGGRSAKAMNMMSEMGFREVYNLGGGFDSWVGSGMPVSKN